MGESEFGKREEAVCVTGGSGYIGSWIVRLLLQRGYTVHATVKNIQEEKETKHLEALEGAKSRLRLFEMDLLDYESIAAAISGTVGVMHVASPCILHNVADPQRMLLDPAINGTINVLTAAKAAGVRRVVVTSSVSTIVENPNWSTDQMLKDYENCWSDEEYCRRRNRWYMLSKVRAEKVAWRFAEENDLDIVVVNPGLAIGPVTTPVLNASMLMVLHFLQGGEAPDDFFMGVVHVKDVALAHILAYENASSRGRHLCAEALSYCSDFLVKVEELYPEYKIARLPVDAQRCLYRTMNASKKLVELGLQFTPMEQVIKETVESLKINGYLS